MKYMKKLFAVLAAAVMVMAMAVPAMADGSGSIKITNATRGQNYTAYKIFDVTANGTAVAYTTDEGGKKVIKEDSTAPFTVSDTANTDGQYDVTKKNGATDEAIITWVSSNYSSFSTTGKAGQFDSAGSTYTISGLDLGYYYVTSSLGTVS